MVALIEPGIYYLGRGHSQNQITWFASGHSSELDVASGQDATPYVNGVNQPRSQGVTFDVPDQYANGAHLDEGERLYIGIESEADDILDNTDFLIHIEYHLRDKRSGRSVPRQWVQGNGVTDTTVGGVPEDVTADAGNLVPAWASPAIPVSHDARLKGRIRVGLYDDTA